MIRIVLSLLLILILSSLAVVYADINLGSLIDGKEAASKTTFIPIDSKHKPGQLSYNSVKPILDTRCVACHAGFDAPCQLQLSSYEGLQRGASKQAIIEPLRLQAIAATRLMIDAKTPDAWRTKGFFAVLNEKSQFPEINLNNSLLAKLLVLKRDNPLPDTDNLVAPSKRKNECPKLDEFNGFQQAHALAGMPYALPGLDKTELDTLLNWLQDGAKNSQAKALSELALAETGKWEQFLNGPAPQMQLTARYVYEHLFSGHLHFKDQPAHEFYRLVRSQTPPGQAIEELDNLHPYTAPAVSKFYYRLSPVTETLVDKTHAVYELSDAKMARIKALFLKPDVTVAQLPAYTQDHSAQPFMAFKDLPVDARQQFLLDDAPYFFSALFKSPALSHHNGLSGLHDQIWVAFFKPRADINRQTAEFLGETGPFLRLPSSAKESAGFSQWFELKALQKEYLAHKETFTQTVLLKDKSVDLDLLWNGDGGNGHTLTVFRHDDNASVVKGWQGKTPATVWVIDYPLFERLHYLLLAGFNAYGDTAHHLSTRLMLDLLRSEAENNFLQFLPKSARQALHDKWYQAWDSKLLGVFNTPDFAAQAESAIAYQTQDYQGEFFSKFAKISESTTASPTVQTSSCPQEPCTPPQTPAAPPQYDNFARQLAELHGPEITALPEVSFFRINTSNPEQDPVYTLIRNRQLRHVAVWFGENQRRQPEQDTLTVLPGLLGSYPNLFFSITSEQLEAFITQLKQAQTETAITQFHKTFAIRRNHKQFWAIYDGFNQKHRDGHPENVGLFDLSRYGNHENGR